MPVGELWEDCPINRHRQVVIASSLANSYFPGDCKEAVGELRGGLDLQLVRRRLAKFLAIGNRGYTDEARLRGLRVERDSQNVRGFFPVYLVPRLRPGTREEQACLPPARDTGYNNASLSDDRFDSQ